MELEAPGTGLPRLERLCIKNILVPAARVVLTWNLALFMVKREIKIIVNLLKKIDKVKLQQKMLIDRTFAIEDDTRQFSVNMVLEHLMIAGTTVKNVIETLSKEEEYKADIKIENVKPSLNKEQQLEEFVAFYETYFIFIKNLEKKQSKKRKKHPWFIEFNNYDWSVFMYMHTFIHRRQIEAILKELSNEYK